jgi:hypothetical protein
VIGLAYLKQNKQGKDAGITVPLHATKARDWQIPPLLPFLRDDLHQLTDRLFTIFRNTHQFRGILERFAFAFKEPLLQVRIEGHSMTVSGFLSLIDAMTDHAHHKLACVATVVQPHGHQLQSVGQVRTKLNAFLREYGRGSLLVAHPEDSAAAPFHRFFDEVWTVATLGELADQLVKHALLSHINQLHSLDLNESRLVLEAVVRQERHQEWASALQLTQSALGTDFVSNTPIKTKRSFFEAETRLLRHLGGLSLSVEKHQEHFRRIQESPEMSCLQEQLKAARDLAASYYDLHQFEQGLNILSPWMEKIRHHPLRFSPNDRLFTWNTFGLLGSVKPTSSNWREAFGESLELQMKWDHANIHRTRNYLLHALIRNKEIQEALDLKETMEQEPWMDPTSCRYFSLYCAYLDRALGRHSPDSPHFAEKQDQLSAYFFLTQARQPGRPREEQHQSLTLAIKILDKGLHPPAQGLETSFFTFMHTLITLAFAALTQDKNLWISCREKLFTFLANPAHHSIRSFYHPPLDQLSKTPSVDLIEGIFSQVPHLG